MASLAPRDVFPDPKPNRRLKAPREAWEAIRASVLKDACCVGCGFPNGLTLHHVVGKDRGGDDLPQNLVPLCMGPGTADCHGRLERKAQDWLRVSRAVRLFVWDNPDRKNYVVGKLGLELFDRTYPAHAACPKRVQRHFDRPQCDLPEGHFGACAVVGDEEFEPRANRDSDFGPKNETWEPA